MKPEDLRLRLDNQEWRCCYCGESIQRGDQLGVAYDGHGIGHRDCAAPLELRAPERYP